MPDCPFYRSEKKVFERATRSGRIGLPGAGSEATIEWCEHKHSPLKYERARRYIVERLSCRGELARCPLSDEEFADIPEARGPRPVEDVIRKGARR